MSVGRKVALKDEKTVFWLVDRMVLWMAGTWEFLEADK
jgi:hypothetical protein